MRRFLNKLYLLYYKYKCKKRGCILAPNSVISSDDKFEGNNYISGCVKRSEVGYGTYIMEECWFANCKIGRYCSIASEVKMVLRRGHPTTQFVSTSPVFFAGNAVVDTFVESDVYDRTEKCDNGASEYTVVIGNDVWIGARAILVGAIKIGDGAIIGTGAVVTKDVPPYAIVAGNPAQIVKYRFTKEQIESLQKIQWWNWEESIIRSCALEFKDVDKFIEKYS